MPENFTTYPWRVNYSIADFFFLSTLPVKSRVETTEMSLKARELFRFFSKIEYVCCTLDLLVIM